MAIQTIDDDSAVMRGEFIEMVTTHPLWVNLVEEFELAACQQLLSTKPHEVKKREGIFATFDGAKMFLDHLKALVRIKYEILEARAIALDAQDEEILETDSDAYHAE